VKLMHSIRSIVVALMVASVFAASASAGGEPKNQWPFTRPVGDRGTQAATPSRTTVDPVIQGEPKNEPPFTRPVTVVVKSGAGFSWTDAGIGVLAGLGIAASLMGLRSLTLKAPQPA